MLEVNYLDWEDLAFGKEEDYTGAIVEWRDYWFMVTDILFNPDGYDDLNLMDENEEVNYCVPADCTRPVLKKCSPDYHEELFRAFGGEKIADWPFPRYARSIDVGLYTLRYNAIPEIMLWYHGQSIAGMGSPDDIEIMMQNVNMVNKAIELYKKEK